tara:strand:- start:534 stop:707 length:174 start_codon:yes stop_codon:yes gene_type:complete
MSKKKPIKTEWKQDDRRDLSDMTEDEIKDFCDKLTEAFEKAQLEDKPKLNQNKDDRR